jgi:lipid-A-disaccharide synthase
VRHFSQPNLLAGKELVPEFFQQDANAANLAAALGRWLTRPDDVANLQREFAAIHARLRCDGAERAASEIGVLLTNYRAAKMPPAPP